MHITLPSSPKAPSASRLRSRIATGATATARPKMLILFLHRGFIFQHNSLDGSHPRSKPPMSKSSPRHCFCDRLGKTFDKPVRSLNCAHLCLIHFAPCTVYYYYIFCNGWFAKMGLVPFRQPSTLFCCCYLVLHIFCCIVENKPLSRRGA